MSRPSNQKTEIARMRCAKGMLQKEVADQCGVTIHHYRMVEIGERKSVALTERARRLFGK